MINPNAEQENLRQTISDFIADPMCEADEAAWQRHLDTFDSLLAEVKRSQHELKCWGKMLELHGINGDKMSAALSFAFADGDSCAWYLKGILALDDYELKWYEDTHGIPLMPCQCGCEDE